MPKLIRSVTPFLLLLPLIGTVAAQQSLPSVPADIRPPAGILPDARGTAIAGSGFSCGPDLACDARTQYCSVVIGGPKGVPPGYSCLDVPDVSAWPSCDTLPDIGVGCECTEEDGGVTVTCTAP